MNIKNYTSRVPADRTIGQIEQLLARSGHVRDIAKSYVNGRVTLMQFMLKTQHNGFVPVGMPANVGQVFKAMGGKIEQVNTPAGRKLYEQAERTAWRNMLLWVEIQLTLVRLGQAEPMEVFLPYVMTGPDRTLYRHLKGAGFPQLSMKEKEG